ncbi:MAG: biotin synthase BioB [Burkholderiaceae bacterium]
MEMAAVAGGHARHWSVDAVAALLERPLIDLLYEAQTVHRRHFDPNTIQLSSLLSIKTGGCPEDCAYCPQSSHHDTGVAAAKLLEREAVVAAARQAKASGATRFCMGAAWRSPNARDLARVAELVAAVKAEGLETCCTLGMLTPAQARTLRAAGLDYYNHNLDTAPEFYGRIITTRAYNDRLQTLDAARAAGLRICCGGIVGMGESRRERAGLIAQLANLDPYPESVPINQLVRVAGTPLAQAEPIDPLEFVRAIAAARITMPRAWVRLSAGRDEMSDELQALCFLAGANSIFAGERLLTTGNPAWQRDRALFDKLGVRAHARAQPQPDAGETSA